MICLDNPLNLALKQEQHQIKLWRTMILKEIISIMPENACTFKQQEPVNRAVITRRSAVMTVMHLKSRFLFN